MPRLLSTGPLPVQLSLSTAEYELMVLTELTLQLSAASYGSACFVTAAAPYVARGCAAMEAALGRIVSALTGRRGSLEHATNLASQQKMYLTKVLFRVAQICTRSGTFHE